MSDSPFYVATADGQYRRISDRDVLEYANTLDRPDEHQPTAESGEAFAHRLFGPRPPLDKEIG